MSGAGIEAQSWDYSALAASYELRALYADTALWDLLAACGVSVDAAVVDIGAGTGRLSRCLAERGHRIDAIEPCTPMRSIGQEICGALPVRWHAADGTCTGLAAGCAMLVSYGSSFNVLPAEAAVREALRLLGGAGQVLVLWNHRDLDDPVQQRVEALIREYVPTYSGGSRREDPLPIWQQHAHVREWKSIAAPLIARQPIANFIAGFRAHATLIRQVGNGLDELLAAITAHLIEECPEGQIAVPFITRAWCMRVEAFALQPAGKTRLNECV